MNDDEELRSEQSSVAELHARLDAERAGVQGEHDAALRGHEDTAVERDVEVRSAARQVKRLHIADSGLAFGRLDTRSGDRAYIGRIGMVDERDDDKTLLLDPGPGVPRVLCRHRRDPGGRASARQFHSRGVWSSISPTRSSVAGRRWAGDAALLAGGHRAAR